jgi:hypothetical protein
LDEHAECFPVSSTTLIQTSPTKRYSQWTLSASRPNRIVEETGVVQGHDPTAKRRVLLQILTLLERMPDKSSG